MVDKSIVLTETGGVLRCREYVRIGVPFAQGEALGQTGFAILNPQEELQPVQTTILNRWNDGSVKWVLIDFCASVAANGRSIYRLVKTTGKLPLHQPIIHITPDAESWQVNTGAAHFAIDAVQFRPFSRVRISERDTLLADAACCSLDLDENNRLIPFIETITIEAVGPLRATLRIKGSFDPGNAWAPQFFSRLHFFAGSSSVIVEFTLRNPKPARHPGGLWDLGDPGSLLFRELALEFPFPEGRVGEVVCSPEQGHQSFHSTEPFGRLSIYQESSGGMNWKSPAHRNRNGIVPIKMKGYEVRRSEKVLSKGDRANPVVWCGTESTGIAGVMAGFWQNFPKAVEADQRALRMILFPAQFPNLHELQGGEQKTTTMYLDFAATSERLAWARTPLTVVAASEAYLSSCVIPDLPSIDSGDGVGDLIDRFVAGPELLVGRRELTDEYGWRNFGELSADHEAVYHQGDEAFISHYNNQYDICAGMYRKFLATGDPLWGGLASDLARHVYDIDIYHTTGDREEYNHGLFWHTDHYVAAGLATHRTFSAEQVGTRNPACCGGGPAAEHCYTTGLLYHYFLTGNSDYRDAVINLAEWCITSLTESQTVLASVKRAGRYISQLRQARYGVKTAFPRYPLSRGTGNAITACLDAFEAGGGRRFLEQAEVFVRGAIHPEDDIAARDLLNAECAWSYTVFMVALAKYIDKKTELGEVDDNCNYAVSSLLAYAEWMLQHEYPYLEKPEILEFPNETWPAQDLRKSVILHHAARYSAPARREAMLAKARFFFESSRDELARHHTSSFTRPVALIMQDGWVGARLAGQIAALSHHTRHASSFGKPAPPLGIKSVVARIGSDFWQALRKSTPQREIRWLNVRLKGN